MAACGVLWLALGAGHVPWVSLLLAGSFGLYGLLRKLATLGAAEGLALETLLLGPVAVGGLLWLVGMGWMVPERGARPSRWLVRCSSMTGVPPTIRAWCVTKQRLD